MDYQALIGHFYWFGKYQKNEAEMIHETLKPLLRRQPRAPSTHTYFLESFKITSFNPYKTLI